MPKGVYVRTKENTRNKGTYVRTPAIRAQIAATLTDRPHTAAHNTAISASMAGKSKTPEHSAAISIGLTDKKHSIGHRVANSIAQTGKVLSEETRTKIGVSLMNNPKISGPNANNWQGGISHSYGPDWLKQKRLALERDNHTCQHCGKIKKEIGKEPDVHHIVPHKLTQDNNLDNLVCLCMSCHGRAERNS